MEWSEDYRTTQLQTTQRLCAIGEARENRGEGGRGGTVNCADIWLGLSPCNEYARHFLNRIKFAIVRLLMTAHDTLEPSPPPRPPSSPSYPVARGSKLVMHLIKIMSLLSDIIHLHEIGDFDLAFCILQYVHIKHCTV